MALRTHAAARLLTPATRAGTGAMPITLALTPRTACRAMQRGMSARRPAVTALASARSANPATPVASALASSIRRARRPLAVLAAARASPPIVGSSLAGNRRAALLGAAGLALASSLTSPRPAIAAKAGKKIDVQRLLDEIVWPPSPPFEADDFKRFDESDDALFYEAPRFGASV